MFTDRVAQPKFKPQVKEAAKSEVIGAVALALVLAVAGVVVVADAPTLFLALQRLRDVITRR